MGENSGRAEHSLAAFKAQTPQHENTEGVIIQISSNKDCPYENHDSVQGEIGKKIGHWKSEKNVALKKNPSIQKCSKIIIRHCLKNLRNLLNI